MKIMLKVLNENRKGREKNETNRKQIAKNWNKIILYEV